MKYLRIVNWENFQHYKDRTPPWIKLHRELLMDYEFGKLSDTAKGHLMLLWILASQLDNKIPWDRQYITDQLRIKTKIDIEVLQKLGFVEEWRDTPSADNEWGSRYISVRLREAVLEHFGYKCNIIACETKENLEIDHIVPISQGGESVPENLQVLCRRCNRKKRNLGYQKFMSQDGGVLRSKPLQQYDSRCSVETETETETETEQIRR